MIVFDCGVQHQLGGYPKHDHEVQLYAFDVLAMGGDDLRDLPLHLRKMNLQRLFARRPGGHNRCAL
ncbi:hypothetical protein [Bradyrhizobium sp. 141]|uniref:hypothetical protein n=1 Tax=Bradyrhizobium sp. 141 TaxID=2782617 RepID=UPI001FF7D85A|nr:hypothetical protein [Bradyrhizobium sp. 141]